MDSFLISQISMNTLKQQVRSISDYKIIDNEKLFNEWSEKSIIDLDSLNSLINANTEGIKECKLMINKYPHIGYLTKMLMKSESVLELLNEKYSDNLDIFFKILKNPNDKDNVRLMRIATD
jgi:hypothetical protein